MNPAQIRDFPDWIGPMLVKELRQGLKARAFEITFITLQVILLLVISYHALLYQKYGPRFEADGLNSIFWFIVGVQLLFITPLRALSGLHNEKKANTLELIFMSGMSSWRIAWGKWASLFFQTLLFVLAVLPYGVLRYFFGTVNLTEDFRALGVLLLLCALFSAVAIAISGLHGFIRFGAIGFFALVGLSFVPRMLFGSGGSSFFTIGPVSNTWLLGVFDSLLICFAALEFAASTIAPIAENHAFRQRLLVLAALLPVPVLLLLNVGDGPVTGQLVFFIVLGLALSWYHFSTRPTLMRVQLEPFSRRGFPGRLLGMVFQPGWPSAVLFLFLIELIFAGLMADYAAKQTDAFDMIVVFVMGGAALLTPPLLWALFKIPSKHAFFFQTISIGLCAGLFVSIKSLESSAVSMGHERITAILPPFGFFAMLDDGLTVGHREIWLLVGAGVFLVSVFICLILSRKYWAQVAALHREIAASPKKNLPKKDQPVPLEVAA